MSNLISNVARRMASKAGAGLVGFLHLAAGAVPSTVADVLNERVSVARFGAIGDGVTDDSAALQKAIDYVAGIPRSTLYFVPGKSYRITAGLTVKFDGKFQDPNSAVTIDMTGAALLPAADNIVCLKGARDFVKLVNPMVLNLGGKAGVIAYAFMPEDPAQTTVKVSQQFCIVVNPVAFGTDVNVKLMPGPTVAGQASGAFYNTIENARGVNVKCNIHVAGNPNALDVLNTRTTIINPQHVGGNCSFWFEAADTTEVIGGSSENITVGTWPCATPTTINIPGKFANHKLDNGGIAFSGFSAETGVIAYNIAAFYCPLVNCRFIGFTQSSVGDQNRTQWESSGAVVSSSTRAGKLAMFAARAGNGKQAYMAMDGAGGTAAEFYSDTGFKFSSPVDIADLRTAAAGGQKLGGAVTVVVGGTGQNALLYNLSNAGAGGFEFGGITYVRGDTDNAATLGSAAKRWNTVYAGTGSINTSDANAKQQIRTIDTAVLRAWARVEWVQYKFNDAVAEKGAAARWHTGVIAQQVKESFEAEGLDPFAYGVLCFDEWSDQYAPDPETGESKLVQPAGSRYGVRYEEAYAIEAAYQRAK